MTYKKDNPDGGLLRWVVIKRLKWIDPQRSIKLLMTMQLKLKLTLKRSSKDKLMRKYRVGLLIATGCLFSINPIFAKEMIVEVYKKQFMPSEITIEAGDSVIWKNIEKRQYHNVCFKSSGEEEPKYCFPDESFQRKFDKPGSFTYECGPHPMMKGTIVVNKSQACD